MNNITLAIIKPDAVKNNYTGRIFDHILNTNFDILAAKSIKMTKIQAEGFYDIHRKKPFFGELITFMTSGKCIILVLSKKDAVYEWRKTIGATNPDKAADGTIRKLYATNLEKNAVHGSDSDENAKKEIAFFFAQSELT